MIFEFIIYLFYSVIYGFIYIMLPPAYLLPDIFNTAFSTVFGYMGKMDYFFPIVFCAELVLLWLAWLYACVVVRLVRWISSLIRG